jgi:predicted alpha/beta-hydrolase family hydrolase
MNSERELTFEASRSAGSVSALLARPADARGLLVLGHGAGAGMRHAFMESIVTALAGHKIASFRYQFPYVERGSSRPDPQPILLATVRSAVEAALEATGDLPLIAGGKSMGGRMTSLAMSEHALPRVDGLVFFGFPLHPAGAPGTARADHLRSVQVPMLFLQGTRDSLAGLDLLRPIVESLGTQARLHVVDGADHGFHVLKRSGRGDVQVLDELAVETEGWARSLWTARSSSALDSDHRSRGA